MSDNPNPRDNWLALLTICALLTLALIAIAADGRPSNPPLFPVATE